MSHLALQPGQVLFCDFDGPIVDVSERYYATYQQGLQHVQSAPGEGVKYALSKEQFWSLKQNRVPDHQIAQWSGLDERQTEPFLRWVKQRVNHPALLELDAPQRELRRTLTALRRHRLKIVIVTLRQPAQVRHFLAKHQLLWAVDDVFGAVDAGAAYGNRSDHKVALLRQAIAAQGRDLDLGQALMVGDTEADVLAGQANAVGTVALTCGIRSRTYLKTFCPDHLMSDLQAVAKCLPLPAKRPTSYGACNMPSGLLLQLS